MKSIMLSFFILLGVSTIALAEDGVSASAVHEYYQKGSESIKDIKLSPLADGTWTIEGKIFYGPLARGSYQGWLPFRAEIYKTVKGYWAGSGNVRMIYQEYQYGQIQDLKCDFSLIVDRWEVTKNAFDEVVANLELRTPLIPESYEVPTGSANLCPGYFGNKIETYELRKLY